MHVLKIHFKKHQYRSKLCLESIHISKWYTRSREEVKLQSRLDLNCIVVFYFSYPLWFAEILKCMFSVKHIIRMSLNIQLILHDYRKSIGLFVPAGWSGCEFSYEKCDPLIQSIYEGFDPYKFLMVPFHRDHSIKPLFFGRVEWHPGLCIEAMHTPYTQPSSVIPLFLVWRQTFFDASLCSFLIV
jgi:hypothetical protein